jgi:class 3 adenylate cyclase
VAHLRQLHKADPVGRGYTVVGFGSQCVPQMLSLALALHDAARALNAKAAAAAGAAGGGAAPWVLQVGLARGSVVTGGLGAQRRRCHFFGGPVAEAARLALECPAGETWAQRGLARAEGAQPFAFTRSFNTAAGGAPAVALTGRRRFNFGGLGGDGGR